MSKRDRRLRKKHPFFACVKGILRAFRKKPNIIQLSGDLPKRCIIVANHAAKSGPLGLELYFPCATVKWGAHEMLGKFNERRRYLRDVFYMRKQGYGRVRAGLLATFEAVFSPFIYRGMNVIASYTDGRLTETIRKSEQAIACDMPVMIFPENSDGGYFEEMREFFAGFVLFALRHRQNTGEDLPIVPCYFHPKKRVLAIGKPEYAGTLADAGMDKREIAEHFRKKVNELFYTYCWDKK